MKVFVHDRIHYTKGTDATGTDRCGCEIIAGKADFRRNAMRRRGRKIS